MAVIVTNMDLPDDCFDCEIHRCCRKGSLNIQSRDTDCPLKSIDEMIEKMPSSTEGKANDSRWTPITEKLPPEYTDCLVVDADGEFGIGYYREDVDAWDSPNWGWLERKDRVDNYEAFTEPCGIGKVVAWMPLPEAYKIQQGEDKNVTDNS